MYLAQRGAVQENFISIQFTTSNHLIAKGVMCYMKWLMSLFETKVSYVS